MALTRSQIQQLRMAARPGFASDINIANQRSPKSWLGKLVPASFYRKSKTDSINAARILRGGKLSDLGRLPRYLFISGVGVLATWLPAIGYIKYGAVSYTSHFALILPGAGSNASVSISEIGQATSNSTSPFSGSSISPTVTYKNLLMSANVINAAAKSLNLDPSTLSVPVVKLVDETSFITVEMSGKTSEKSRDNANAIKDAFFTQLNILREDELKRREDSISETVKKYGNEVNSIRSQYNALQVTSGLNSIDQYNTIVNANENLKVKLADSESALAKVEESYISLKKELDLSPEAAVITMKLHADPEFTVLIDAAAKAEADYAQASEQFGSNHPKLVDARNKYGGLKRKMESRAAQVTGLNFSSLRKQIDFSAAGQGSTMMAQLLQFNTERQGLEAQNAALRSQFEKQQNYIVSMAPIVSKMENINRDYKLAEAVFTSALGRISTSKSDIFASYPMAQVIEPPVMPFAPSSPNKKLAIGAAAAATFILLFACVLGWIRRPLIDKLLLKTVNSNEKSITA